MHGSMVPAPRLTVPGLRIREDGNVVLSDQALDRAVISDWADDHFVARLTPEGGRQHRQRRRAARGGDAVPHAHFRREGALEPPDHVAGQAALHDFLEVAARVGPDGPRKRVRQRPGHLHDKRRRRTRPFCLNHCIPFSIEPELGHSIGRARLLPSRGFNLGKRLGRSLALPPDPHRRRVPVRCVSIPTLQPASALPASSPSCHARFSGGTARTPR